MLEFSTLLLLLVSYFIHQIISKEVIKLYTKSWDKLGSYNVLLKNNYSIKCFILNIIYACAYINRSIVGPKEGGGERDKQNNYRNRAFYNIIIKYVHYLCVQ
jgi:hypothetical protein